MIAAPYTGTVVQIQPVYLTDGFIGATRPTATTPPAAAGAAGVATPRRAPADG
jgi:hypothetical protein